MGAWQVSGMVRRLITLRSKALRTKQEPRAGLTPCSSIHQIQHVPCFLKLHKSQRPAFQKGYRCDNGSLGVLELIFYPQRVGPTF